MTQLRSHAVPVVPNASQIRGRLLQVQPEPEGRGAVWTSTIGAVWTSTIDEARDVEGIPNFAQA